MLSLFCFSVLSVYIVYIILQVVQSAGVFLAGRNWLAETGLSADTAVPLTQWCVAVVQSPGYFYINTLHKSYLLELMLRERNLILMHMLIS